MKSSVTDKPASQGFTISPKIRFALYIISLIGGLTITLGTSQGWFDTAVATYGVGINAIISGLAAWNTPIVGNNASQTNSL